MSLYRHGNLTQVQRSAWVDAGRRRSQSLENLKVEVFPVYLEIRQRWLTIGYHRN